MAEQTNISNDQTPTLDEQAVTAPKVFSKTTLAVIGVAIVFLIIASIILSGFFSSPGG